MRRGILFLICLSFAASIYAQRNAVTDNGESVILYDNGTWKFVDEGIDSVKEIPLNPTKFTKNASATFLLKSSKINLGFWIDAKKWSFKKAENNDDAEYSLQLKNGDLYSMIICEKIEIPVDALKSIALENGRAVAPDLRIVKEEYRMVNGLKVLLMQMDGTMQGVKFSYYGYYFSNSSGTIQYITYTSQNLLAEYKSKCEDLLNGLVLLD